MYLTPEQLDAIAQKYMAKPGVPVPKTGQPAAIDVLTLAYALRTAYSERDTANARTQWVLEAAQALVRFIPIAGNADDLVRVELPAHRLRWLETVAGGRQRNPLPDVLQAACAAADDPTPAAIVALQQAVSFYRTRQTSWLESEA